MALDHYVSQVHLRQFLSPTLSGGRLFAYRKSNGEHFAAPPKSLCRIEEGNTNPFLTEPRAVEEFLTTIEPHYNTAIRELRERQHTAEAVRVVAGFCAYVSSCSPAAMRIHSVIPRLAVESVAAIMDAQGGPPPAPKALGGARLSDLIMNGDVNIEIDPKFPQALGVSNILRVAELMSRFEWEVLHNEGSGSPFLTSDFPTAIASREVGFIDRVVPLAPDLAVRIFAPRSPEASSRKRHRKVDRSVVMSVNRTIARCAEDLVFSRDDASWVATLVHRNRRYRAGPASAKIPTGTGYILATALGVHEAPRAEDAD